VAQQYALGIEPIAMMRAQMDIVHKVTVAQIGGSGSDTRSPEERAAIEGWARDLAAGQLHRLWQLLLKGYEEVKTAPDPLVAAQMALLRVLHAADMPDPGSLVKKLEDIASRPVVMAAAPAGENGDGSGGGSPACMFPHRCPWRWTGRNWSSRWSITRRWSDRRCGCPCG
jgi:DNA polymerase-3 subunit gamma/tau